MSPNHIKLAILFCMALYHTISANTTENISICLAKQNTVENVSTSEVKRFFTRFRRIPPFGRFRRSPTPNRRRTVVRTVLTANQHLLAQLHLSKVKLVLWRGWFPPGAWGWPVSENVVKKRFTTPNFTEISTPPVKKRFSTRLLAVLISLHGRSHSARSILRHFRLLAFPLFSAAGS